MHLFPPNDLSRSARATPCCPLEYRYPRASSFLLSLVIRTSQFGLACHLFSPAIRSLPQFVLAAIRSRPQFVLARNSFSPAIRSRQQFVLASNSFSPAIRSYSQFVLASPQFVFASPQFVLASNSFSPAIRSYSQFVLTRISYSPAIYQFALLRNLPPLASLAIRFCSRDSLPLFVLSRHHICPLRSMSRSLLAALNIAPPALLDHPTALLKIPHLACLTTPAGPA
jgi:hypothetical protein